MDAPDTAPTFLEKRAKLRDWVLLRPQSRWLRNRRRDLRVFVYLRRKTNDLHLADAETFLRSAIIGTIAFDRPDLIEWQIHLIRQHLAQARGYVVFDNSSTFAARQEIRIICAKNRVPYVGLPKNPFQGKNHSNVMYSHGCALTWACRNFVARFNPAIFGFLDHDIFPTTSCDVGSYLRTQPAYGIRVRSSRVADAWSLWAGYCFFSGPKARAADLDFTPSFGFGMPTGGGNWPILYRHLDAAKIKFAEAEWLRIATGGDAHESFFQVVDDWLHVGNASNWREIAAHRQNALDSMLRSVAGIGAPTVQLQDL